MALIPYSDWSAVRRIQIVGTVNTSGPTISAQDPLYMASQNVVASYPAGVGQSGHMTTGAQSVDGKKTFTGGVVAQTLEVGNTGVTVDGIEDQYPPSGSHTKIPTVWEMTSAITLGLSNQAIFQGNVRITEDELLNLFKIFTNNVETLVVSPTQTVITGTNPQLMLQTTGGAGTVTLGCDNSGVATINASGNELRLHSSDKIFVLNNGASSSKTTGALTVNGGIGVGGDAWVDQLTADSVDGPQVNLRRLANTASLEVNNAGSLYVQASGASVVFPGGQNMRQFNAQNATTTTDGSIHTDGGLSASLDTRIGGRVYASGVTTTGEVATSGTNLDLLAGATGAVRVYTGAVLPGTLSLSVRPANLDVGINQVSRFFNTLQATSPTVASVTLDGGLGVAKDIRCAGTIYGALSGSFTPTVPLILQGAAPQLQLKSADGLQTGTMGVSATGLMSFSTTSGQEIQTSSLNPLRILSAAVSGSQTQGALIVAGGVGVGGMINGGYLSGRGPAGDHLALTNSTNAAYFKINVGSIGAGNTGTNFITTGGVYFNGDLPLFEQYLSDAAIVWGGAIPTGPTVSPITYVRQGRVVTFSIDGFSANATSNALPITPAGGYLIPFQFRPMATQRFTIQDISTLPASQYTTGTLEITNGGVVNITHGTFVSPPWYTVGVAAGLPATTVSYLAF